MSNKPKLTIVQQSPVVVHINKNGRPINLATAELYAKKNFPLVKLWKFEKTDHSILAKEVL